MDINGRKLRTEARYPLYAEVQYVCKFLQQQKQAFMGYRG